MDLGIKNKVAFITGASSGIGLATAELFAKEGAKDSAVVQAYKVFPLHKFVCVNHSNDLQNNNLQSLIRVDGLGGTILE